MIVQLASRFAAQHRFGVALVLAFLLQVAVIVVFFLAATMGLEEAQRVLVSQILAERGLLLAALLLLLLGATALAVKALVDAYPAALARLAEDVVMMAADPRHRAAPQGALEVQVLGDKFNALAGAHQQLHEDVQARIDRANRALSNEKNRFAALMSELALCVLVCNIEGRILLYNLRAKQFFETVRATSPGSIAAIGLGRSVFGVIERGYIVHALEQIQHGLQHRQDGVPPPVSRFVATLAEGRTARATMVPVLDDLHVLGGFVLTLEDISRNIETDSRRDALIQALTQDSRAALANIRAAVEAMQAFPDMSDAKRAQFTSVIEDESQRLARHIGAAVQQHSTEMESHWQLEEMRATDLVELLLRRIDAPALRTRGIIDTDLWLRADSYALTQALAYLAKRLGSELGLSELHIGLERSGRLAQLDLTWNGPALPAETLGAWENDPISSGGAALTLNAVVARHGGASAYRFEPQMGLSRYRLLLPVTEPQPTFDLPPRSQDRPEFYDFDLFHQPGQNPELDQRLLSQLIYTVFDTETTGLDPSGGDEIISIGAVRIVNGRLLQQEIFDQLVKPRKSLSAESIRIHGITAGMLAGQPKSETVLPMFHRFVEDTVLIAHNAAFDMRFLQLQEARTGVRFTQPVLDTLLLSQVIHPHQTQHSLEAIAARLGVTIIGRHTALGDAIVTGEVFLKMIPLLAEKGILSLKEARDAAQQTLYARLEY